MKPCVCDGTNKNCMYCGGSGQVADNVALPRRRTGRERWAPESARGPKPPPKVPVFAGGSVQPRWTETAKGCLLNLALMAVLLMVVLGLRNCGII